jgi:hypothetical protein
MAGYGQMLDYEPGEQPGTYRFLTRDGRKVFGFGAEAEALKQKLDQAKAMGPQPTAGVDFSKAMVTTPAPAPAPVAADFARPNPSAATAPGFDARAAVGKLTGAPAGASPAAPPPAPAGLPGRVPVAPGHRYNPETGLIEAYRGGSFGSKGGIRDTSQSVRGAVPTDPAYVAGLEEDTRQNQAANEKRQEGEQSVADAEHSRNFNLALSADDALRQAKDNSDAVQDRVSELWNTSERLSKEYNSAKVDPSRMMAGGKNWLYGLFAGMSTFGASIAKSPAYGLQVIEGLIADDIRAQEAEVAVKRDAADNAFKRYVQETGSSEVAKRALRVAQLEKVHSEFEVMAKDGRDKQRQAQGIAMAAATQKKLLEAKEAVRVAALGDVTKNMVYVPATAGRPAGWYPVSDQLGTAGKIQNLQQGEAGLQKTQADIAKTRQDVARGPEPTKKTADVVKYENTLESASRTLQDFVEANGGTYNPETGEITGNFDMPIDLVPGADSEATAGTKSTLASVGNVYANMLNAGAEAGQPFKEKVTPQPGMFSNDAAAGQLKAMGREIAMRRQQARNAAPQPVQETENVKQ